MLPHYHVHNTIGYTATIQNGHYIPCVHLQTPKRAGGDSRAIPVSTLDRDRIFYWQHYTLLDKQETA